MILELNPNKQSNSYNITVQSRSKSAFGRESENGILSSNFDSSHGKVTEAQLSEMGIPQALSKLENLPDGGHEVDAYGQG